MGDGFQVQRISVKPSDMDDMMEAMRDHKFEVMTTLLKQEYQRTIVKQQERMLESIGEEAVPVRIILSRLEACNITILLQIQDILFY